MIERTVIGLGAALCVALLASPSQAAITWDLKPPGTGDWDWRLMGVYQWYGEGTPASVDFQGILWKVAAAHCIEVSTQPGRFAPNPDTRIWVRTFEGEWVSLNDDWGGTWQSRARFWVAYDGDDTDGQYFSQIRPYAEANRYEDFHLIVTRLDLTEAQCTTNQTSIPWAKFIGIGSFHYTLTISPNAT